MARKTNTSIKPGFEEKVLRLAISNLQPLRLVTAVTKATVKYAKIAASIKEIGIVEPPVVARDRDEPGKYLLLDGHLRIEVLKELGESEVLCLVSVDDDDLPPLKWSSLKYDFRMEDTIDGKEEAYG